MLDIHLGQSKDSAAETQPAFKFDEAVHAKVFSGGIDKSKFQKLSKIRDYYADAMFVTEELPELIKEICEMLKLFSSDEDVAKSLQAFKSTCETASKAKEALFCFAD
jgi:hypothetical protein